MRNWGISAIGGAALLALVPLAASAAPSAAYKIETVAEGLAFPWALAFLPDGTILVTEREGRLRTIRDGVLDPEPVAGVPETYVAGQGGLMDVVLHPRFAENGLVYLTYAHGTRGANATRAARGRFDGRALNDLEIVFTATPTKSTAAHYGARIAFLPDGTFLLTVGDGFNYREQAQKLDSHLGKVVRLRDDGSVPDDNPFVGRDGARAEIWTWGHRNEQAILHDAVSGRVYEQEHGPRGGDEINLLEKGKNYGWPIATYGIDYSGAIITPFTEYPGTEQPLLYWVPSIAPGGMTLYRGDLFPQWKGDLFNAALAAKEVRRVDLNDDGSVAGQESLFKELDARIRAVASAPDGSLYLTTDSAEGRVLRVIPAQP